MESNPPRREQPRTAGRSALVRAGSLALLFAVAVLVGGGVVLLINHRLDTHLHVATDIIGYPTFHDFNPYVYEEQYYLTVIVFPLVVAAALFIMVRAWRHLGLPLPTTPGTGWRHQDGLPSHDVSHGCAVSTAATVARVAIVGLVWGLITAVARGDAGSGAGRDVIAVAALYGAGLAGACRLLSRRAGADRGAAFRLQLARVNVVGAVLTVSGVVVASGVTRVQVSSDGTTHHYQWLAAWASVVMVGAALILTAWRLRRAGTDMHVLHRLERRVVFLVAVPVGLFLLIASMPGVVSQFSAFEDGQSLTTLRLVQHGAFPWRDWATTHGVLEDALQTLLSSSLIQDSTWGITAGYTLLVVPALLLSVYYLAYRVLGHTWPFLVALGLTFLDPGYASALAFLRFAFWPLLLILLGVVIDRRRPWLAVVLGAALVVQAVVSQETAYCIPAVGIAILGSDVQRVDWRRRGSRLRGFAMTAWTAAGGAIVAVVLMVILVSQHALGDFIRFYTAFLPDHALTGGIPHLPFTGRYRIEAVLPIAGMLAAVALLVSKLWLRRVITTLDWMLAAATILAFLYYPKFLDRADGHVERALATSLPMLLILAAAALKAAEPAAARVLRAARGPAVLRYSVAAVFMAIVLLVVPIRLGAAVSAAPSNFRMVAASEPSIPALGYHAPTAIDPTLVSDLGTFLHAYLKPGDHVFDFSNEPGLLYYLLDFRPSTPYYTVSVAMRHVVQQDLVDRLRVDRPLFVVYTQGEIGLPAWDDVPNMVRHYDVSQYLLANYRPFAQVHGQVIYVDRRANVADPATLRLSLSTPLVTADLPFRGSRCDWGYSPNFLSVAPADPRSGHESLTVTLTRDGPLSYTLTLPPGRRWDEFHWFEIHPSAAFSSSVTSYQLEDQPPPAGEQRAVTFVTDASSPASYRFPIGACSQWPAYESAPLHLTMSAPQEIASVRLAP